MATNSFLYYGWNKEHFYVYDELTADEFSDSMFYTMVDFVLQFTMLVVFCVILYWKTRINGLRVGYHLFQKWRFSFLIVSSAALTLPYYLLAKHGGCDFHFQFEWI